MQTQQTLRAQASVDLNANIQYADSPRKPYVRMSYLVATKRVVKSGCHLLKAESEGSPKAALACVSLCSSTRACRALPCTGRAREAGGAWKGA
jgi:hypothetical protein